MDLRRTVSSASFLDFDVKRCPAEQCVFGVEKRKTMKKRLLQIGSIFCMMAFLTGCQIGKKRVKVPDFGPYRVIGYVGNSTDISRVDPTKVTHINYAFAKLTEDGELYFRRENDTRQLAQLTQLKHRNPNLSILLSVGGWGADHFSDAALTSSSRRRFAKSAVQFVTDYSLDGVDLDWEYPGQPGPGIKYREEDRQNFTLLLKTVREHLDAKEEQTGRNYLLTIATSGSRRYFEHTEMEKVHPFVDYINVMTYDFYTTGSRTTGHHAGLYKSEYMEDVGKYAEVAIARHVQAGIPLSKIILGVAFYGRGWRGVEPVNQGLFQPFDKPVKSYSFRELKEQYINLQGYERHWDEKARAPYLWQADSAIFVSYEDPESLKSKSDFIKQQKLGGVMFWEYSHDHDEALLDSLVKGLSR